MRALLSSSSIDRRNGYGNITYELTQNLAKKGVEITLLLPREYPDPIPSIAGVSIEKVLPKYLFQALRPELLKYLFWSFDTKGREYDIVHSLFETPYAPLLAREAKRMKKPFIIGTQGSYGVKPLTEYPERLLLMYAYNAASAIHAPSAYTKNTIIAHAGKSLKIDIIHNGVDFHRFDAAKHLKNDVRERYSDKKILLTVGQLKNRKGQDIVIRALPKILEKHPDTVYLVVGDDGWGGYLARLAQEMGVSAHVIFTGPISNDIVPLYFHACDVYVHTARISGKYFFEGFGIVYLEAASCGKPSVGTDAGGITDALLHEQTGLVAESENVDQVSEYVNRLLSDPILALDMGERAKTYAREHTWENISERFLSLYKRVVSGPR